MARSIRSIASASLLLALLLAAPAARADDAEEAKLHFEKAQVAYKLGRFDEAIKEYEAAYRAMAEAAFLFNIAQAHRQQYQVDRNPAHIQKALSLYRAYLREAPSAQNRDTVIKLIEELKSILTDIEGRTQAVNKQPGVLVLRGDRARGATVRIEGKVVGTVPLSTKLEAGSYFVQISLAGHSPWSSAITIASGSHLELPVVLEPLRSSTASPAAPPVYKRWWFWTIIGAVAVAGAGVGVGVYYGTRENVVSMPELDLR